MKDETAIPEITKASSKGQIVIPTDIRKKMHIKEGSVFGVTSKKDMIILKKLDSKMTEDDLKTLKSLEEAWKDIEEGRYKEYPVDKFFKEIKKW